MAQYADGVVPEMQIEIEYKSGMDFSLSIHGFKV